MPRIVIFANGELPDPAKARALLRPGDMIVCANGGSHHALALGLQPDLIIGDLDSIRDEDRAKIQAAAIPLRQHPRDKNETDLELALRYALEQKPDQVMIVGALGKRLDQALGNIAMLSSPALASASIRLDDGVEEAWFCRRESRVQGRAGDLVSLIAWGAPARGVTTEGLKWALHAETLYPEKTRGISNEMLQPAAEVRISSGLLLIIHRRQTQSEIEESEAKKAP